MVLDHQTSVHMNLGGGKERRHRQQHQIFTSQQKDSSKKSSSNETLEEEIAKWREERKKRFPKLEAEVVEKSVPNCENEKNDLERRRTGRGVGEEEGEAVTTLLLSSPYIPVTSLEAKEEPDHSGSTPFVASDAQSESAAGGIRSLQQQANNRRRRNREKRSKGRVRMDQSFDDAKRRRVTLFQKVTSVPVFLFNMMCCVCLLSRSG